MSGHLLKGTRGEVEEGERRVEEGRVERRGYGEGTRREAAPLGLYIYIYISLGPVSWASNHPRKDVGGLAGPYHTKKFLTSEVPHIKI